MLKMLGEISCLLSLVSCLLSLVSYIWICWKCLVKYLLSSIHLSNGAVKASFLAISPVDYGGTIKQHLVGGIQWKLHAQQRFFSDFHSCHGYLLQKASPELFRSRPPSLHGSLIRKPFSSWFSIDLHSPFLLTCKSAIWHYSVFLITHFDSWLGAIR